MSDSPEPLTSAIVRKTLSSGSSSNRADKDRVGNGSRRESVSKISEFVQMAWSMHVKCAVPKLYIMYVYSHNGGGCP